MGSICLKDLNAFVQGAFDQMVFCPHTSMHTCNTYDVYAVCSFYYARTCGHASTHTHLPGFFVQLAKMWSCI